MEVISICLSDIPKEQISVSDKNGKSYINLVVDKRKEPDMFGNTLTVYISQSKDERERREKKIYIGNGKEFLFNNQNKDQKQVHQKSDNDDLPF